MLVDFTTLSETIPWTTVVWFQALREGRVPGVSTVRSSDVLNYFEVNK